jgi:alcohol dehydrogenase YqhD (iron-dependent ADH family)
MNFSFYTSNEIIFGNGKITELPQIAGRFGQRVLLSVRGQSIISTGLLEKSSNRSTARALTSWCSM